MCVPDRVHLNADLKRMAMYSLQDFTPSTTDEFDSTIHGSDYTQAPTNIAGSRVDIFAAFKMNGAFQGHSETRRCSRTSKSGNISNSPLGLSSSRFSSS